MASPILKARVSGPRVLEDFNGRNSNQILSVFKKESADALHHKPKVSRF